MNQVQKQTIDQAGTLRALVRKQRHAERQEALSQGPRVIAIASGKGGVGKTSIAVNLASALSQGERRILLLDGDLGLANLDIAFGVQPKCNLRDVVLGRSDIQDALISVHDKLSILAGHCGGYDLANMSEHQRIGLFASVDTLEHEFDTLVIDTAAGVGANAIGFASASEHVIVVTNGEPTALADCYGFIKTLSMRSDVRQVHLIANMVSSAAEGEEVYRKLGNLLGQFLRVGVDYLGYVPRDIAMRRGIQVGKPTVLAEPDAPSSQCLRAIAHRILRLSPSESQGGVQLFWRKMLKTIPYS